MKLIIICDDSSPVVPISSNNSDGTVIDRCHFDVIWVSFFLLLFRLERDTNFCHFSEILMSF